MHTSKHEIMIPQAGAILATRGVIPANNAEEPSVRMICRRRGHVLETWWFAAVITRACRRVLRTSKGDVISAAEVPLMAPLIKATQVPSWPYLENVRFHVS